MFQSGRSVLIFLKNEGLTHSSAARLVNVVVTRDVDYFFFVAHSVVVCVTADTRGNALPVKQMNVYVLINTIYLPLLS